jgi:hypothetical protein
VSYVLVINNTIQREGGLPRSAQRLDNGNWVMQLATKPVAEQKATGWYQVTNATRPADTPTHTSDRSLVWNGTTAVETWTVRPKTTAELAGETRQANAATLEANLAQDLALMQTIIDTANTTIVITTFPQAQQAIRDTLQRDKDIAKAARRLIKLRLGGSQLDTAV